ncbi:unnamed protein product [Choristocarpus tenellus]
MQSMSGSLNSDGISNGAEAETGVRLLDDSGEVGARGSIGQGAAAAATSAAAAAGGAAAATLGGGGPADDPAARRNVRLNVVDGGVRGVNASRLSLLVLCLVNIPQVVAGVLVLGLHWNDDEVCDESHRQRWRWWALVALVRLVLVTPVIMVSM